MCLIENLFQLHIVWVLVLTDTGEVAVVWMELQPIVKVAFCISLNQFVGARNSKQHERVQVVRVCIVSLLEREDSVVILVVLLIELAEEAPCLIAGFVLLNFSFETQNSFLNLLFADKFLGDFKIRSCV